jgi:formylglycine-generating enzyme required for sulfatase activity
VIAVTARQAAAFCRWLGRRLPSDAEWERAARGSRGAAWPWGEARPTRRLANVQFADLPPSLAAADDPRFRAGASHEGVVQLVGNVWEWTRTPASCDAYRCARTWDGRAAVRTLWSRGRSWTSAPGPISGDDALPADPTGHDEDQGFRCAKSRD